MHRRTAATFGAALPFLSAYSNDTTSNSTGSPSSGVPGKTAKINVFTAASLKESFEEMEKKLESAHPDVDLVFSFAGSQELVEQINSDIPTDVVATANMTTIDTFKSGGKVVNTKIFVSNTLVLITPKGNPTKVADLNSSLNKTKLAICTLKTSADGKTMPCGTATAELARKLGVKLSPAPEEQKVTDIHSKVMLGRADAGIVYRTGTVTDDKKVETTEIPGADTIANSYSVGVVKASKSSPKAKAFAKYVMSRGGQATLEKHGFNEAGVSGC